MVDKIAIKQMKSMKILLIKNIKVIIDNSSQNLYFKLRDLYDIGKKLNPKYTIRQMSIELDIGEQKIYKLLEFRNANNRTIDLVKEGKISFYKVVRFFAIYGKGKHLKSVQDNAIDLIIEKNMTIPEIEECFKKKNQNNSDEVVLEARVYKNKWNLVRDIKLYTGKLEKSLLSIDELPKDRKDETIKRLEKLSLKLRKVLKNIKGDK